MSVEANNPNLGNYIDRTGPDRAVVLEVNNPSDAYLATLGLVVADASVSWPQPPVDSSPTKPIEQSGNRYGFTLPEDPLAPTIISTSLNANARACDSLTTRVATIGGGLLTAEVVDSFEQDVPGVGKYVWWKLANATLNGEPYVITNGGDNITEFCVAADLIAQGNQDIVRDAVEERLAIQSIPTSTQLAERWQNDQGVTNMTIPLAEGSIGGGGVPDAYTQPQIDRIREIAATQGIETINPLVISNGRTGEALEYAVVAVDLEGNPYYHRGAEDNKAYTQAPDQQASYLETYPNPSEGTLAWQFTSSGLRLVAVNERNQVIGQFDMESKQWVEVEVPEFDILTEDEMQVVKDFLAENGITGGVGPTINHPHFSGLLKRADVKVIAIVGKLSPNYFVGFVPSPENQRNYYKVYDDGSNQLEAKLVALRSQLESGELSVGVFGESQFSGLSDNYNINPTAAEDICQRVGTDGATCRDFFSAVGIGVTESLSSIGAEDPYQLLDINHPIVALVEYQRLR